MSGNQGGNISQMQRDHMKIAIGHVDDAHTKIAKIQSDLHTTNEQLKVHWRGESAGAFQDAFTAFNDEYTSVLKDLAAIHEKLQQSLGHYGKAEDHKTDVSRKLGKNVHNNPITARINH
jgi:WXG100 family type VII secretion target